MFASNYKSERTRCCYLLTQRKIKTFLFKQLSEFSRRCTLLHHDVLAVQIVVDLRVYYVHPNAP